MVLKIRKNRDEKGLDGMKKGKDGSKSIFNLIKGCD